MKIRTLARSLAATLLAVSASTFVLAQPDEGSVDAPVVAVDSKRVLGWVENTRLYPDLAVMKAKLDPGARSSAIHAEDIQEFIQNERRMVRFTLLTVHDDPSSKRIVVERPVVGEVNIKLRNTERPDQRLVVRLEFCLAGERHNTLFTLANRSNFNYPILLGRQFLSGKILVDSSQSFTHKTRCPQ